MRNLIETDGHRGWLARATCERLAEAFGTGLGHVRVRTGPAADVLTTSLHTPACARDETIFLHRDALALTGAPALRLLAHEVAHLVQQSRPGAAGDPEAEADAAAAAVLRGARFRCRIAARPDRYACWDQPGHYYSIYLLGLGAGLDPKLALRVAYYCQLPDLATQLDATRAGFSAVIPVSAIADKVTDRSDARDREIQVGLHALSGERAEREFQKWNHILRDYSPNIEEQILPFGLALHAFGDSYSHRTSDGMMYRPPFGHAPTGEPDVIGPDREKLFLAYVDKAYAFLRHAARDQPARAALGFGTNFGNVFINLARTTNSEITQIQSLRVVAAQLDLKMDPWTWNGELTEFSKLQPPAAVPLRGNMLLDCYRYAREWSAPAAKFIA